MATVSTELDLEIQKLKTKAEEVKAEFRKMAVEAEKTKLGEKLGASLQKSTLNEFRALKEAAVKAARERGEAAKRAELAAMTPSPNEVWGVHAATKGGPAAMVAGRGGRANVGMAAMQVQDIAVQAQMGTSALTIVAQQGSQLASIFGPAGMIAGGVLAVGGMLLKLGSDANKSFKVMIDGASDLHRSILEIAETGNAAEVGGAFSTLLEKSKELDASREKLTSFSGAWNTLMGLVTGGPGTDVKLGQVDEAKAKVLADQVLMIDKILGVSARELELTQMRAEGRSKEADEAERQFEFERRIAALRKLDFDEPTKAKLISNATREKELQDEMRREQERNSLQQVRDRFNAAERAVDDVGQQPWEKLQDLNAEREALQAQIGGAGGEKEKLELAIKREEIERQIVELQMQMVEEGKRLAKEREAEIERLKEMLGARRFGGMSDTDKLKVLEKKLEGAQGRLNSPDEKERLEAENEVEQTKQEMDAIMQKADQTVSKVSAPGAISSQFDWAMGGSSSLVNDEQAKNTQEMRDLREQVRLLREKLPATFGDSILRFQ
jgi:hypothetical protein